MSNENLTYKDAGVDIKKGDAFVEKIKQKVRSTYNKRVKSGVGGFACLYESTPGKYMVAGTDGVGTKLLLAQKLNVHSSIGIDLVAMCANDVLCTGATPLFFMDYLACGKLNLEISDQIIDGVVAGCKLSGMALIGGETAEMPGMYNNDDYDLAGFCVGEVLESDLIDGSKVVLGDKIVGLKSSGAHSNGFSLLRKLIKDDEIELLKEALIPTRIYVKSIAALLKKFPGHIKGISHITGGGIQNIPRINAKFDYKLTAWPKLEELAPIFTMLHERLGDNQDELYKTFNMGIGMAIITDKPKEVNLYLKELGEQSFEIGEVVSGNGQAYLADGNESV